MYLTKKFQLTWFFKLFLAYSIHSSKDSHHPMMPSAKAFSNDSSCRWNLLICFTGGCSGPTDLPPTLESCTAAASYQNAEWGERAVSGCFFLLKFYTETLSTSWLCHSGTICAGDLYCIKRKANSIRSSQVKNWSAGKYQRLALLA